MHDIVFVEFLEGLEELPEDDQCLVLLEYLFLLQVGLEGAAVAVLVDEVEVVGGFEGLDEPHDVLVFQ